MYKEKRGQHRQEKEVLEDRSKRVSGTLSMVVNRFGTLAGKGNMANYFEKKCPKCKQRLRIPKNVGGVTMVCPTCGTKMASDFKIGQAGAARSGGILHVITSLFEQPGRIFDRLMKIVFPG